MAQAKRRAEIWSVPNRMSMARIALIPLFVAAYRGGRPGLTAALLAVSALTDVLDGYVARRFGQVTQVGKVLDPAADKLTLIALALCLAQRDRYAGLLLAVLLAKEGLMATLCALFLRRGGRAKSARWYGKATTAALYAGMGAMAVFPGMPEGARLGIAAVGCAGMVACAGMYLWEYRVDWRETGRGERRGRG